MKKSRPKKNLRDFIAKQRAKLATSANAQWLVIVSCFSFLVSFISFYYFYNQQLQNLADYDAIARLNIARKMIDSITPGFGQLGGIWLPFPQILEIPFVWNDFLWHSGIAGAVVSMAAFVIAAVLLYNLLFKLTGNRIASMIGWLIFVTNINMLFLQTMAMSESFFSFTIIMIIFYLTSWTQTRRVRDLIFAAIGVTLTTLTRYEGYMFLIGSLTVVAVSGFFLFRKKQLAKLEGLLIVFGTLAFFGIILWSLYSATIYGDPIYWFHLYTGKASVVPVRSAVIAQTPLPSASSDLLSNAERVTTISNAIKTYGTAMLYMNGFLITIAALVYGVIMAIGGSVRLSIAAIKRKDIRRSLIKIVPIAYMPVVILTFFMVVFLILGYQKGIIPTIETPALDWQTMLSKANNIGRSSNIRYGIIVLPFLAIGLGIAAAKNRIVMGIIAAVIVTQLVIVGVSPYFIQFVMPVKYTYSVPNYAHWFKDHYDYGLVLVSANRFETFMFQTGLPYKTFIYEGTRQYWFDSLENPSRYARWIVFDESVSGDAVFENLKDLDGLSRHYELVHQENTLKIFRRIDATPTALVR